VDVHLISLAFGTEQLFFFSPHYLYTVALTPMANSRCNLFSPTNDTLKLLPHFPKYWHTVDFALFARRLVNNVCSFITLPTLVK